MAGKFALLIGASSFREGGPPALSAPEGDVTAFHDVLRDHSICGFDDVKLSMNTGLEQAHHLIHWLFDDRSRDDLLLLYYTGHGFRDPRDGQLWLSLTGTRTDAPWVNSLAAERVKHEIDFSRSERKIVILDCCHSGAFGAFSGVVTKDMAPTPAVTRDTFSPKGYGSVTLASSSAAQPALEVEGRSIYTRLIVEALRTGAADPENEYITTHALHDFLATRAKAEAREYGALISPVAYFSIEEPLTIARNPRPFKPLPDDLVAALWSDDPSTLKLAVFELSAILEEDGDERRVGAARAELKKRLEDGNIPYSVGERIARSLSRSRGETVQPEPAPMEPQEPPPAPVRDRPSSPAPQPSQPLSQDRSHEAVGAQATAAEADAAPDDEVPKPPVAEAAPAAPQTSGLPPIARFFLPPTLGHFVFIGFFWGFFAFFLHLVVFAVMFGSRFPSYFDDLADQPTGIIMMIVSIVVAIVLAKIAGPARRWKAILWSAPLILALSVLSLFLGSYFTFFFAPDVVLGLALATFLATRDAGAGKAVFESPTAKSPGLEGQSGGETRDAARPAFLRALAGFAFGVAGLILGAVAASIFFRDSIGAGIVHYFASIAWILAGLEGAVIGWFIRSGSVRDAVIGGALGIIVLSSVGVVGIGGNDFVEAGFQVFLGMPFGAIIGILAPRLWRRASS